MKTWVVRPVQGAHEQLWMGHADDAIEAVKMAWARGIVPMRAGEYVCVDHDANVFYVAATDKRQTNVVDVEFAPLTGTGAGRGTNDGHSAVLLRRGRPTRLA